MPEDGSLEVWIIQFADQDVKSRMIVNEVELCHCSETAVEAGFMLVYGSLGAEFTRDTENKTLRR